MDNKVDSQNAPKFKMTTATDENMPRTVQRVTSLSAYIVEFVNHESKNEVRICLTAPGSSEVYLLQAQIQGAPVTTMANRWFAEKFKQKLAESVAVESV